MSSRAHAHACVYRSSREHSGHLMLGLERRSIVVETLQPAHSAHIVCDSSVNIVAKLQDLVRGVDLDLVEAWKLNNLFSNLSNTICEDRRGNQARSSGPGAQIAKIARRSNERMVVLEGGGPIVQCTTVRRRLVEYRWSAERVVAIKARPSQTQPGGRVHGHRGDKPLRVIREGRAAGNKGPR